MVIAVIFTIFVAPIAIGLWLMSVVLMLEFWWELRRAW